MKRIAAFLFAACLLSAPLGASAAFERAEVSVVDGEVVTDGAAVRRFDRLALAGEDADLIVREVDRDGEFYTFRLTHVTVRDGEAKLRTGFCSVQDEPVRYDAWRPVRYDGLDEWGCVRLRGEESARYLRVIDGRELWDDYDERTEMVRRYLDPIYRPLLLTPRNWTVPDGVTEWVYLFQSLAAVEGVDLSRYEDPEDPTLYAWPLPVMLETLSKHFDGVTRERILADGTVFDVEGDVLYTGSSNGYWGMGVWPWPRLVTYERDGDLLTLHYELFDSETGEAVSRWALLLRTGGGDEFHYLGNWKENE